MIQINQITSRDVSPYVDVMGASILTNTVTVNGQTAYRKEEYFRQQLPANNATAALWTNITVAGGQSTSGSVFVAQSPEVFRYDPDGNLTNDGRWSYTWDAENRLVSMTNNANVGPQYQLTFKYDSKSRRIQKVVATNGVVVSINNFLYDGWNLVAEIKANSSQVYRYFWGLDLSGSLQGAGGVGGLLWSRFGPAPQFAAYDGNGNVMALIHGGTGAASAQYEYGPFGELLRATGQWAKANPFRFSTKYQDDETDLSYYGYRFYNPSKGTWPNHDPIGEEGGANLYGFVGNDSIGSYDVLGLFDTGSQGRTDAVKNSKFVRSDVANMVDTMLASRDKSCTKGKAIERKRFTPASTTSYAFMYSTGYFLLGQVSVPLDGKGYYEVDCCKKKFGKWEIVVHGSFRDKFDQLLPPALVGGNGYGSLPLTFVGEWVEFYSGSE